MYAGFSDPRLPRFSARERTEIGGGRLRGEDVPFGRIVSVAADPLRVYTLDAMNQAVFVHTLAGQFVTSFGRRGEGPGELSQPVAVGFVDPDSVFVFDAGPGRLNVFSTRGKLLRTEVVPTGDQFGQGSDVRFGAAGTMYRLGWEKYQASLLTALGPRTAGAVRGTNSLQRWSEAEHAWTGLADVPGLEVYAARSGAGGGGSLRDVPYPARVLWSTTRNGLWYADNETYTLVRLSADGERRCELRVRHANPPVTETERAAYYDATDLAGDPRFEERLASIRQTRASIPVPATKPSMDALVVSGEGNLWVRVPSADGRTAPHPGRATWQVFTPAGRPIGAGTLPAGLHPVVIRHDEVIGVLTDSLGVQRLGMLSISWRG